MDINQALVTGVIQGLTEFLPVSSSGHIVLVSSIYKYLTGQPLNSGGDEEIFFDIMLHVGTLIAVLVYFRKDIMEVFKTKTPLYISIGTIATVAVVFPLKEIFEANVSRPDIVGLSLIGTGILLLAAELWTSRIKLSSGELTWKKAIIIGLAQGLAAEPGISRSASTIATGLATGMDRVSAARFSFLLSIPIIILAAGYDTLGMIKDHAAVNYNWPAIIAGTLVSALVGYYCIKYFIAYLGRHSLNIFAYYCFIVGLGMFLFFRFN